MDKSPAGSNLKSAIGTSKYVKTGIAVKNTNSTIKSLIGPKVVITTKPPYHDKKYTKVYNPPPNEVGFLGGVGNSTGFPRSKVHINRPTMTQKLLKMTTSNRLLVSFSEELQSAHSLTRKQLDKSPAFRFKSANQIQNLINTKLVDVTTADNIDVSKSSCCSSEPLVAISSSPSLIDVPTETSEKSTKKLVDLPIIAIKKPLVETIKFITPPEDSFRTWALNEREKRNQVLQQASFQQNKQEREQNEVFPKVKKLRRRPVGKFRKKDPISGYLYGPFTKSLEFDHAMNKQTKFGVPLSMFTRAEQESTIKNIYRKKLQTSRLEYMKIPTIPSDSESDNDETMEDTKHLSLVRTPFNTTVPKVTTKKTKRVERLKSKFLTGNRLKRIGYLLFDRSVPLQKDSDSEATGELSAKPESSVRSQSAGLRRDSLMSSRRGSTVSRTSAGSDDKAQDNLDNEDEDDVLEEISVYRRKYKEFLQSKYLEKYQQYNDKLNQKLISFERFRESERTSSTTTAKPSILDRKSFREFSSETASISVSIITPEPSFKKVKRTVRKNARLSGYDNETGPFYIDPFLLEKEHDPEKGMKIVKNYPSLMRGLHNVRRRLHVNGPTFDEEFSGQTPEAYFHRLATEFDNHYINEIRYRPQVRKFCVKTDIIKIREMTRKKFLLYFMQEDLMNLFAKQDVENNLINKTNNFVKLCEPQFKQLQDESYQKAKEKLEMVKPVCQRTAELRKTLDEMKDKLDLLMQKLMFSERKWETIMKMQNYYYMLMLPLWRLENDWIHRNKAGQLDMLKKSIVYCKKIHIRYKTQEISLHAIKRFFEASIEPKLDKMRQIKPDVQLLKYSLDKIKSNLLGILNKHNEIMMSHAEILYQQQLLEKLVPNVCAMYQKNMKIIENKVNFILERKEFLMREVESVSNNPLIKCVKNVFIRKIDAITNHFCKTLFPDTFEIDESVRKYTITENFCFISNHAMKLLSQLDKFPTYILHISEIESRNFRKTKLKVAKIAMNEQNLFNMLQKQLKNHFTRPARKSHRKKSKSKGKPKRS